MADISLKYWQELESLHNSKSPGSLVAIRIARLLGVRVDDLFGEDEHGMAGEQ